MKKTRIAAYISALVLVLFMVSPVIYMAADSVMSTEEIVQSYQVSEDSFMKLHLVPRHFSLEQYYQAFFKQPEFLKMFWNSMLYAVPMVAGQVCVSVLAAYAFSKINFPGRDKLFFVCIILLLLPLQVTIVPNYIILNKLNLLNTRMALIAPGIFSAFGVCLLRQSMKFIPDDTLESARIDGAGELRILFKIVLPQAKGGLATIVLLSFIEYWNMVEQPLVYLKDHMKYPLSLYLATINENKLGISFACGVIFMIPVVLLYAYLYQDFIKSMFQEE